MQLVEFDVQVSVFLVELLVVLNQQVLLAFALGRDRFFDDLGLRLLGLGLLGGGLGVVGLLGGGLGLGLGLGWCGLGIWVLGGGAGRGLLFRVFFGIFLFLGAGLLLGLLLLLLLRVQTVGLRLLDFLSGRALNSRVMASTTLVIRLPRQRARRSFNLLPVLANLLIQLCVKLQLISYFFLINFLQKIVYFRVTLVRSILLFFLTARSVQRHSHVTHLLE